jgi:metallo-beta-lactamase family protein
VKITFLGASGTVTGSRFLVQTDRVRVLVDCGLFQGLKVNRLRNREPFPVPPSEIDAIVLTHAHLDHSGFLPVLVREGFTGPIHCTPPTADLCEILLRDSGKIQEEDARRANRRGYSKHSPALPLYTKREASSVFPLMETLDFDRPLSVGDLTIRFSSAGHILGAASVHLSDGERSVLISGDLGGANDLLIPPPAPPPSADWIVMESTYGDRDKPDVDPLEGLAEIASETFKRGGVLLVPSFAVGRAQVVLYALEELMRRDELPRVPVYLDSPMASDVTDLYRRYSAFHRLSEDECAAFIGAAKFTRGVSQSKKLNRRSGPMAIVASSGMLTGGRVLHHLTSRGADRRNTVLLVGYQAEGSRGSHLLRGERSLKIHGRHVAVNARVAQLDAFSAHADQGELLGWLGSAPDPPRQVVLVHGEPRAADVLRCKIEEDLEIPARVAEHLEVLEVD